MRQIIRKILLKITCIEQVVSAHQDRKYHENWAELMRSGNTARKNERPLVDYLGGRTAQRQVTPVYIDSVN